MTTILAPDPIRAADPQGGRVSLTKFLADQLVKEADPASLTQIPTQSPAGAAPAATKTTDIPVKLKAKTKAKVTLNMANFGLTNESQWLLTSPARYEDYKTFTNDFKALYQGTPAMIKGRVELKILYDDNGKETLDPKYASRLSVTLCNAHRQYLTLTAFGRPGYGWKGYEKGSEVIARGTPKISRMNGKMELTAAEVVRAGDLGKILPVYPKIRTTAGQKFADVIRAHRYLMEDAAVLLAMETGWNDRGLSPVLSEVTQFTDSSHLLRELHNPSSVESGQKAQRAAKFLSAWTLIRKTHQRLSSVEANPKSMININPDLIRELKDRVPFELTSDQVNAIDGICRSLRSPLPMTGLLTGDVGSGKTLAFLVPMVAALRAGKKPMLMTPNLLLISQVAMDLEVIFPEIPVCKVTGKGVDGNPENSIVIGSSALLGAMKKGKLGRMPDFLVVDEQQKFSVAQRNELIDSHTNSMEASATPIPRTAALATHGAKDLFMLHQLPVVKQITSSIMNREKAREARNVILNAIINQGEQAAVIYPIVETTDPEKMLQSVSEAAANWARKIPMEQIAVLHGRMKDVEKNEILDSFRKGHKRLLLSSTVIEVGVTLPELKTMLVLGADRFGVVTLHQLRGRLARKGGDGTFIMFTESDEDEVMERLGLLVAHQDGFTLAEKDAEKRGYGDILGVDDDMQSGKTRTIFLGVEVGPTHISFAANLHEKLNAAEDAALDAEAVNLRSKKGESLRLL